MLVHLNKDTIFTYQKREQRNLNNALKNIPTVLLLRYKKSEPPRRL